MLFIFMGIKLLNPWKFDISHRVEKGKRLEHNKRGIKWKPNILLKLMDKNTEVKFQDFVR